MTAAIEKEKVAKEFVEPKANDARAGAGSRKEDDRSLDPPHERTEERFTGTAGTPETTNVRDDFFALGTVAAAKKEAEKRELLKKQQAERQREISSAHSGSVASELWMAQRGGYAALSPELKAKAEKAFDKWKNQGRGKGSNFGIEAYVMYVQQRWTERPSKVREATAGNGEARFQSGISRDPKAVPEKAIRVVTGVPLRAAGKLVHAFVDAAASLFAPTLTPQQIYEGEKAKGRREAEADKAIDFSRIIAEAADHQEKDREAARQRDDGGGRER